MINVIIRTRRFETFLFSVETLRRMHIEEESRNQLRITALVTTLYDLDRYGPKIAQTFRRDYLLFLEWAKKSGGFELAFIFLDKPEHRLPNNRNLFASILYESLHFGNEVFSLDDDLIFFKPHFLTEVSKKFEKVPSVLGAFAVENPNVNNERLPHSCFIYVKNTNVEPEVFMDHDEAQKYGDWDIAKFKYHKDYVDLSLTYPLSNFSSAANMIVPDERRKYPKPIRTEYFHHIDSLSINIGGFAQSSNEYFDISMGKLLL